MQRVLTIISLILFFSIFSSQAFAADKDIVAKIGDRTITLSDLDRIISYAPAETQQMILRNPNLKKAALEQYVQSIVLSDLAKKKGFDEKPAIREKLNFYRNSILANEFLKKEASDKLSMSEEEKQQYYKDNPDEFNVPEMVRARGILVAVVKSASPEAKAKAKEKAEDILKRLKAGEDFAKLASEVSDDPTTKAKGGDTGFFARGMVIKPLEDAAFSLKLGEISDVIETPFGYEIIKVEEKKAPYHKTYDEAKAQIVQNHLQKNMNAESGKFLEKAMKDANAVIYDEKFTGTQQ